MAYDEILADRVRDVLAGEPGLSERKMFGGLAFMLDGHMCCGLLGDRLMLRLGADEAARALRGPHVEPMDFTGRPMTGMSRRRCGRRRAFGRLPLFRYEVRGWREGVIPDIDEAVESPQRLSDDPACARRLLELVPGVPTPVWGRDELSAGEMWNSNSTISWLIARSSLDVESIALPHRGRAPGWHAGIVVARRQQAEAAHWQLATRALAVRHRPPVEQHEHFQELAAATVVAETNRDQR